MEAITLRPDPALRGMLDPLRVAPAQLRQDAAVSFLRDLLPGRAEPAWETSVVGPWIACSRARRAPTCLEVVRSLARGRRRPTRRSARRSRSTPARGLTQLGFADPDVRFRRRSAGAQVTYLPIRDLPAPRAGHTALGVLAGRARRPADRAPDRDVRDAPDGRRARPAEAVLLRRGLAAARETRRSGAARLAAAHGPLELAVPIISTQLVTDAPRGRARVAENLLGATFVFGMRSEAEAARALALLGLDPEDRACARRLYGFEAGRCLFRDHRGRVEAIQVDLVVPSLLRSLSTTPPLLVRGAALSPSWLWPSPPPRRGPRPALRSPTQRPAGARVQHSASTHAGSAQAPAQSPSTAPLGASAGAEGSERLGEAGASSGGEP